MYDRFRGAARGATHLRPPDPGDVDCVTEGMIAEPVTARHAPAVKRTKRQDRLDRHTEPAHVGDEVAESVSDRRDEPLDDRCPPTGHHDQAGCPSARRALYVLEGN